MHMEPSHHRSESPPSTWSPDPRSQPAPAAYYSDYRVHHPNHLNPEEAVQAFEDIRATMMVPMHWGTFELNREPFQEPPDRLLTEALRRGLEEQITLLSPGQTIGW